MLSCGTCILCALQHRFKHNHQGHMCEYVIASKLLIQPFFFNSTTFYVVDMNRPLRFQTTAVKPELETYDMSQVCGKLKPYYTKKEQGYYELVCASSHSAIYFYVFSRCDCFLLHILVKSVFLYFQRKDTMAASKNLRKFRGRIQVISADEIVRPRSISVTIHFDLAVIPSAHAEKLEKCCRRSRYPRGTAPC